MAGAHVPARTARVGCPNSAPPRQTRGRSSGAESRGGTSRPPHPPAGDRARPSARPIRPDSRTTPRIRPGWFQAEKAPGAASCPAVSRSWQGRILERPRNVDPLRLVFDIAGVELEAAAEALARGRQHELPPDALVGLLALVAQHAVPGEDLRDGPLVPHVLDGIGPRRGIEGKLDVDAAWEVLIQADSGAVGNPDGGDRAGRVCLADG